MPSNTIGQAQRFISRVSSAASTSPSGGSSGGPSGGGDPNLGAMKSMSKRLIKAEMREPWQFRLEIEGAPGDWDLYCKEVTHTPIELEPDAKRVGAFYLNYLNGRQSVTLSTTVRDSEGGEVYQWFKSWVKQVVHEDGTWGVPADYLRTAKLYNRNRDGSETLRDEWRVQPIMVGEMSETVERGGNLLEFPLSMMEFRGGSIQY